MNTITKWSKNIIIWFDRHDWALGLLSWLMIGAGIALMVIAVSMMD